MVRAALVQLCSGDDPAANLPVTEALVREAAAGGAALVLTPECTNIVSGSRARQRAVLAAEAEDATLARMRAVAAELAGLAAARVAVPEERRCRRAVRQPLVADRRRTGRCGARYDKIHMFDVDLDGGESYRESAAYRPGEAAVLAEAAGLGLGMTICYDMRFPHLYRDLGRAGAEVLAVPSAFTVPTGRAHWHVLLRARAIEAGAYVLAPAQSGVHAASRGAGAVDLRPQPRGRAVGRGAARPRRGDGVGLRRDRPGGGRRGRGPGCRRSGTTGATLRPAVTRVTRVQFRTSVWHERD